MESKTLKNVLVIITDKEDKINPGEPISVKLNINKAEDVIDIEKVPPKKVERERSIPLHETPHKAQATYQPNAKKIHLWWYLTSDTLKASVAELRNELLSVFDKAIEQLRKCDI